MEQSRIGCSSILNFNRRCKAGMSPRPPEIVLSEQERAELERLVRGYTTGQQLAVRARIVLAAGDGLNNSQIARWLDLDDETPGHWRGRWLAFRDMPATGGSQRGRAAGGCAALWCAGEVHAGAGVPNHRPGL